MQMQSLHLRRLQVRRSALLRRRPELPVRPGLHVRRGLRVLRPRRRRPGAAGPSGQRGIAVALHLTLATALASAMDAGSPAHAAPSPQVAANG